MVPGHSPASASASSNRAAWPAAQAPPFFSSQRRAAFSAFALLRPLFHALLNARPAAEAFCNTRQATGSRGPAFAVAQVCTLVTCFPLCRTARTSPPGVLPPRSTRRTQSSHECSLRAGKSNIFLLLRRRSAILNNLLLKFDLRTRGLPCVRCRRREFNEMRLS